MKIVVAPQAVTDIEVAMRWWLSNRPKAPEPLQEELRGALAFISETPHAGIPMASGKPSTVRRVPLPRSRYLLYYRVLTDTVRVLRLWHMSRLAPPLR